MNRRLMGFTSTEPGLLQGEPRPSAPEVGNAAAITASKPETGSRRVRARLRKSGGSVILSIPKTLTSLMGVDVDDEVVLSIRGTVLEITAASMTLAERLAVSPSTPEEWQRDGSLDDEPVGRELL